MSLSYLMSLARCSSHWIFLPFPNYNHFFFPELLTPGRVNRFHSHCLADELSGVISLRRFVYVFTGGKWFKVFVNIIDCELRRFYFHHPTSTLPIVTILPRFFHFFMFYGRKEINGEIEIQVMIWVYSIWMHCIPNPIANNVEFFSFFAKLNQQKSQEWRAYSYKGGCLGQWCGNSFAIEFRAPFIGLDCAALRHRVQ